MKIKSLLIGMLACTALVGCTSDDDVVVDNGNENNGKAEAYMSVKLIMNENGGTRSVTDGGYAEGEKNEQWIKGANSIFLFYDAYGNWVTSGQLMDENSLSNGTEGTHHTGDINDVVGNAYVVLSSTTKDLKDKVAQVLTVVNHSNPSSLKNLSLEDAYKAITRANTEVLTNGKQPTFGFLMSTSVYFTTTDGANTLVKTTAIDPDTHIKATREAAKASPVEIYIERAAAKVQLSYTLDNTTTTIIKGGTEIPVLGAENNSEDAGEESGTQGDESNGLEGNDITINGTQYPAYISIEGWTVNNVNHSTYLVKHIDDNWMTTTPLVNSMAWNNAADYRSYWAKGTSFQSSLKNETENEDLTAYSYNDAIAKDATTGNLTHLYNDAMYCYEQTISNPSSAEALKDAAYPNVTTVLVAAKVKIYDNTQGDVVDAGTLIRYGGLFFTEAEYKKMIASEIQSAGYVKLVSDNYVSIEPNDITFVTNSTLAGINVKISEDITIKKTTTTDNTPTYTDASASDVENMLNGTDSTTANQYVADAEGYLDGMCYYQIPIEHLSSQTDTSKTYLYGVVRNHWYKLNISKIIRIGEGVFNPAIEIPQIPAKDMNYYMAARLHVLNWHVMNQDVVLD